MVDKKLAIIYYYTPANEEIVKADVERFYEELDRSVFSSNGVIVDRIFCPNAASLNEKLKILVDEPYGELYLHFSGHGMTNGIPFNDWVVNNDNFATMVDHPKIVSCFFSSCKSADLAAIASRRKIPIIIGTSSDNDIENNYAIAFQKSYYAYLAKKMSLLQAFQKATNDIEQKEATPISEGTLVRGITGGNIFDSKPVNKLQIVFHEESDKERHFIYPNIVDALKGEDKNSKIIITYVENDKVGEDFKEAFYTKELHKYHKLFLLKDEDFTGDISEPLKKQFTRWRTKIKFLFLLSAEAPIFENSTFKNIFDDDSLLDEDSSLKFGVAAKQDVVLENVFKPTTFLKNALGSFPRFEYEDVNKLFDDDAFDRFINEFTIEKSQRMQAVLNFPCEPIRNEVDALARKGRSEYACAFLVPSKYEDLVHLIINWLRSFWKIFTPIIISDHQHKGDQQLQDALVEAIKNSFKGQLSNKTPKSIISEVLGKPHVVVFRTSLDASKLTQLKSEIINLFDTIETTSSFIIEQPPEVPTFLFFINHDDFDFGDSTGTEMKRIKNLKISPPETTTKESFDDWIMQESRPSIDHEKLFETLREVDFATYVDQGPAAIVELVCEKLKVPTQQILKII